MSSVVRNLISVNLLILWGIQRMLIKENPNLMWRQKILGGAAAGKEKLLKSGKSRMEVNRLHKSATIYATGDDC